MSNPDALAWQNMYSTGEGQSKGPGWAKKAIWGNIPDNMKAQFGNVDNVSSRDFMNLWSAKVNGGSPDFGAIGATAGQPVSPISSALLNAVRGSQPPASPGSSLGLAPGEPSANDQRTNFSNTLLALAKHFTEPQPGANLSAQPITMQQPGLLQPVRVNNGTPLNG